MPEVARKNQIDIVNSPDGTGPSCNSPTTQATYEGSSKVFVEGTGVVRAGDAMLAHPGPGCIAHAPVLTSFSTKVFVEGKGIGRKGDEYEGHAIATGSSKVFVG